MTERPQITAQKVQRIAAILADEREVVAKKQAERPGGATDEKVRASAAQALRDVADEGGSLAGVNSVPLPSERLGGGGA